ncbi:SAM domain and HD [Terramyces sp. JEL0728]|nr:SAM domain and HD [Terramyces sp. JEL0728]
MQDVEDDNISTDDLYAQTREFFVAPMRSNRIREYRSSTRPLNFVEFATTPVTQKTLGRIVRYSSAIKSIFTLYLERDNDELLPVMYAVKKLNSEAKYLIYTAKNNVNDSDVLIGKVKTNVIGTSFSIYGENELAFVQYDSAILGPRGPRRIKAIIPALENGKPIVPLPEEEKMSLSDRISNGTDQQRYLVLKNKPPQWNVDTNSFVLDFGGRVSVSSVKNFQIIHENDLDYISLQFGRIDKDKFTIDAQYPFTLLQAFGIALTRVQGYVHVRFPNFREKAIFYRMQTGNKFFNDPIYGHIELTKVEINVIDTPQFQRLRELKQLGASYFVYPGATHHRFEHCIGNQPELDITDNDVKCIRLAGLTHDLGHGPFSHLFDSRFIPKVKPDSNWFHEQASEEMLSHLLAHNAHIDINLHQQQFIKDLIHGAPRSDYPQARKKFLFEIVANTRNSVDVDKFDYILRDCYNIGIKCGFDPIRLITFSRVIDNQICFHHKEAYHLYELFHTRYSLFKQVYTHRVSTVIEYMICDALISANPVLKISEYISNMKRYTTLDDSILLIIEKSDSKELAEARKIIKRIRQRDLYRFADQLIIPVEHFDDIDSTKITSAIIKNQIPNPLITENDIIVQFMTLNYAMKDKNPVDSIRFFTKYDSAPISIKKEQVSGLIPEQYKEVIVRIFSRNAAHVQEIQKGFRKVLFDLNHAIEGENMLYAESESKVAPGTPMLAPLICKDQTPIADSANNPFLVPRSASNNSSRNNSPQKRLLEISEGHTIKAPAVENAFTQSLKKIRKQ